MTLFALVGLGNPDAKYQLTRHNMGFLLIDAISERFEIPVSQSKFHALTGRGLIHGHEVVLIKPQTYMNLSGKSVLAALNFFKIPEKNLLVIFDDLDLPQGEVKTRFGGGHGGHNGVRSILEVLPTDKFFRIKIGIGKPEHKSATAGWVLQNLSAHELEELKAHSFPLALKRILNIMQESQ